jgi:hypothetical protein
MAGFEVIIYGRFWVIAEVTGLSPESNTHVLMATLRFR